MANVANGNRVARWIATLALGSIACGGSDAATTPPAVPAPLPAPVVAPPAAPVADTTPAPAPKQLISITTKSPDAKIAFSKGWDLLDNGRNQEALDLATQALAADPDFALGHALVGMVKPGAEGQAELDKAKALSTGLPDAERLFIEAQYAFRHQDAATGNADIARVAQLAPDDFHAQTSLGYVLFGARDFPGAKAAFAKALDLNSNAAYLHAMLGWTLTQLRDYDGAVAEGHKYVDGAPGEGMAHMALAEMLLNVGKTTDADGELTHALALTPKARQTYYDLASVKTLEGDFAAARDTLGKSQAAEAVPSESLDRASRTAWVLFTEGKNAEALKLLDATEKDSDARKLVWPAAAASVRAWALWIMNKPGDALKVAEAAMPRCDRSESSSAYKANCRLDLLTVEAFAQIQSKKVEGAQKTVAKLQDETKNFQGNDWVKTEVGILSDQAAALASKDPKAAAAIFAKCPPDDFLYKLSVLRQATSAGDKATADAIRKDVLGRPLTDPQYALVAKVAKK